MKKLLSTLTFSFILFFATYNLLAQPLWQRTIGFANDSLSQVSAITVLVDNTEQIYVLTNYNAPIGNGNQQQKIILNKYNSNGILQWTYTFDNQGLNNVRAYDMRLDGSNNVYIAGGRIINNQFLVLFFKVTSNGVLDWVKFGNSSFDDDLYTKIEFRNNLFYLRGNAGVAVYNQNGIEQYSIAQYNSAFDVDYSGRIVLSAYISNFNLVRYTNTGVVDFIDSTIQADKILCDHNNDIFLVSGLNGISPYSLIKHDSDGQFQWSMPGLPNTPPFGDWNYGILETGQNEYILHGVADSIIKFNQDGQIIWRKQMGGIDDSKLSCKIIGNGFILVTGSIIGLTGSDVVTKIFNTNGVEVWSQLYSGTANGADFGVDVDADNNGIYVISQLEDSTNFIKYLSPASDTEIDFTQVCVDSVWIDSTGFVHITIFNGNFSHINYPVVSIVSPAGDTISIGTLNFFAQLGNSYQEYINTITSSGILDFSNYSFFINNSFNPDTTAQILFCIPTGLKNYSQSEINVFPNPAKEELTVQTNFENEFQIISISDICGREIWQQKTSTSINKINVQNFTNGVYVIKVNTAEKSSTVKLIISH